MDLKRKISLSVLLGLGSPYVDALNFELKRFW
jgi:hypothetical protein